MGTELLSALGAFPSTLSVGGILGASVGVSILTRQTGLSMLPFAEHFFSTYMVYIIKEKVSVCLLYAEPSRGYLATRLYQ